MLERSGSPGSLRRLRASSVLAGRSFSQIASGSSPTPMTLSMDLLIFDEPSMPMTRAPRPISRAGLAEGGERVEQPAELVLLGDVALDEDRALCRVEAGGHVVEGGVPDAP